MLNNKQESEHSLCLKISRDHSKTEYVCMTLKISRDHSKTEYVCMTSWPCIFSAVVQYWNCVVMTFC